MLKRNTLFYLVARIAKLIKKVTPYIKFNH